MSYGFMDTSSNQSIESSGLAAVLSGRFVQGEGVGQRQIHAYSRARADTEAPG